MDITKLAADVGTLLRWALPVLTAMRPANPGEFVSDGAAKLWALLRPRLETDPQALKTVRAAAAQPAGEDAHAALQSLLAALFGADAALAGAAAAVLADTDDAPTAQGSKSIDLGLNLDDFRTIESLSLDIGRRDVPFALEKGLRGVLGPDVEEHAADAEGHMTHAKPPLSDGLLEEQIRLDVASPDSVEVDRTFEVAVRVSQPDSPPLTEEALTKVTSRPGRVFRKPGETAVRYRIGVSAVDCTVHTPEQEFLLYAGQDSEPIYFQLTPLRAGVVTLIVSAYQPDDLLAAMARVQVTVSTQVMAPQPRIASVLSDPPTTGLVSDDPLRIKLYSALSGDAFSLEDLEDLCFRLNVDWDDLSGDTKPRKARALVQEFAKRGQLAALRTGILADRPNLASL